MDKSEQKPCGCRQGECETKADHACRMTAEIREQQAKHKPLTRDEVRLLTCMHSGAPWDDQLVQILCEVLVVYEDLCAQNKRPFDPADLEGEAHDAYFRRLEQLLARPAT
jgi:hypothetical protein